MRRTALPGHALRSEGNAYRRGDPYQDEDCDWYRVTGSWTGVALCECGWTSPVLEANNARKRWHRDVHKPEMRAQLEETR